jgi:hypothetical protein
MSTDTLPKKPKLKPRQRKAVKAAVKAQIKGLPLTAVAGEVFPDQKPESARVSLSNILRNTTVQEAIEAEFDNLGISLTDIVQPIKDGLQATRTVIVRDKAARRRLPGETDEEYEERQTDASFIDERPDLNTRMRAADMAAKFLGLGKSPKDDDPKIPAGIQFIQNNTYIQGK